MLKPQPTAAVVRYKGSQYQLRKEAFDTVFYAVFYLDRGEEGIQAQGYATRIKFENKILRVYELRPPIPHEVINSTYLYLQNDLGLAAQEFYDAIFANGIP